jgi:hypothetical protein
MHSARLHLNACGMAQEMKTVSKRNDMMEEKKTKQKKKKTCKSLRQRSEKKNKKKTKCHGHDL